LQYPASQMRILVKKSAQEVSVATAYVTENFYLGEVVFTECFQGPRCLRTRVATHRIIENLRISRIGNSVFKRHTAKLAHESILFTVADHAWKMFPESIMLGTFLKETYTT